MSKELTPLEALDDLINYLELEHYTLSEDERVVERKQIIETALKRLESVDRVGEMFCVNVDKKLKALDIIKSKEIMSVFKDIMGKCFIVFNTTAIEIPQEEYDLLKEVLL